jgi:hypothetical protein
MRYDWRKMKSSQFVSLIAVFASVNIVFDSLIGLPMLRTDVWSGWVFMVAPITGMVLGPYAGFLSTLIGVMIGHSIYFRDVYEFFFTFGAPIGAMASGFLFRGRWKIVLIYYTALFGMYFITPVAWQLPVWGMWDVYLAYVILLVITVTMVRRGLWNTRSKGLPYIIAICTIIGLEADVLFRIFILVPCQTYQLFYTLDVNALVLWWAAGAFETPIKVAMSTIVTTIVGLPVIKSFRKVASLDWLQQFEDRFG